MGNKFRIVVFFGILFILMAPSTAWEWTAHKKIVDEVYVNLPSDVQKHLKPHLDFMKEGSTYPDRIEGDKINHGYPGSYPKTDEWLNKGKSAYEKGNYKEAAWCFGVASHYITDTFSAPHCGMINNKDRYWQIGNELTPRKYHYQYTNLKSMLAEGNAEGKNSIRQWDEKENRNIVQQDLNRGTSATYIAILYHAHPFMLQSTEFS